MTTTLSERTIVQDLARRLAELAAEPVHAQRRRAWTRHNDLTPGRPLLYISPEGAWQELMPPETMACEDAELRGIERGLRMLLYQHEVLRDDVPLEAEWIVHRAIRRTGWGLEPRHRDSTEARGAWGFEPQIQTPDDLAKLRRPEWEIDDAETARREAFAHALFDGILQVRTKGWAHVSFHMMAEYTKLRGLQETMMDMIAEPRMLHDAMRFMTDAHLHAIRDAEDRGLFSLNNDRTYQSSGGWGYTRELPRPDADPQHPTPPDLWASAESQELAQVSPEHQWEFAMQYEAELLAPFGLTGYGCCEDLTRKLPYVFQLPRIRRISVSPFADVAGCAEQIGGNYIVSWKPQPAHLVGCFNEEFVRSYLRHGIEATRAHGCCTEIILKDTHTCENRPERFTRWSEIAREEIERAWGPWPETA